MKTRGGRLLLNFCGGNGSNAVKWSEQTKFKENLPARNWRHCDVVTSECSDKRPTELSSACLGLRPSHTNHPLVIEDLCLRSSANAESRGGPRHRRRISSRGRI